MALITYNLENRKFVGFGHMQAIRGTSMCSYLDCTIHLRK